MGIRKHEWRYKNAAGEIHNIKGKVIDYFFVTKLFFEYEGRKIEMGIQRNILKREKKLSINRIRKGTSSVGKFL